MSPWRHGRRRDRGRIARARKLARLTQLQLAHKANVSVSLLRKVERGARPASPAFIAAVAGALGVNIEDLTGQPYPRRGTMPGLTPLSASCAERFWRSTMNR
ncbi:helix-turn-helix transcriptional regulator [Nocardia abscessus]|nr:helix-turn-helix transcriptional regulator [Nocardia abscessus]